jgi:type IV pilus assembly protein PilB
MHYGLPLVDLGVSDVPSDVAAEIPLHVLERCFAVPYAAEGESLKVAVADPRDAQALDQLRLATPHRLEIAVAAREDIAAQLRRLKPASASAFVAGDDEAESDVAALLAAGEDQAVIQLVNTILSDAAQDAASDVHFEPQQQALLVRFRVDGVLHETQRIPKRLASAVTTRLKVLAKLDIAERRRPQDGRMSLDAEITGRALDIRVATLPTVEGESVTIRLLDKSQRTPTLEDLGLNEAMCTQFRQLLMRPTGAVLVTGPTGSGKSTTLYSALSELNRPEINIITVEDPVEYRLTGVNQVQINVKAGLTFANALRSILRSDPDVVMVGEIRDGETAKISVEAALTGHFVLSTIHTNDAPGVLTRLNEMGVEPFLTGSAVSAVVAQRLARKLCAHCCEMYTPSVDDLTALRVAPEIAAEMDGATFYRRRGCPRCNYTGYRGRIGIFQFLTMSETLESLAAAKASRDEIERAALREGMRSLWDDGFRKVGLGLTSVEELARVVTA